MRKIAVIDCETDPFKYHRIPKPFIWGYYDGDRFLSFTDTDEMVAFLSVQDIVVYAHNGGKFDYHFLLNHLSILDPIKIINGRLAKFNIGDCEFRDSFNILPVPLAAYQKDFIDYAIFEEKERAKPENWLAILEYLESDCVYLYELVTKFIERFGFHLTLATASLNQWEQMAEREAPETDVDYYNFFSSYYYGGRVECGMVGEFNHPAISVDINSAYPFAMLNQHPIGIDYVERNADEDHQLVGGYFYKVECESMGAFPIRLDNGEIVFPADGERRVFTVTGWELIAAIETHTIDIDYHILSYIVHDEYISFRDYIEHFYQQRLIAKANDDAAESLFCKLMMNSLYGKFAANPDNYREHVLIPPSWVGHHPKRGQLVEGEKEMRFSGFLGRLALMESDLDDDAIRYYNIATAASITGYVRAYLWRAICACDGFLYCDTDSITCESINVPIGPELGQWEIEGEWIRGSIAGKKLYEFESSDGKNKHASKGVRLTPKEIRRIANGEKVKAINEVPTFSVHSEPRFTDRVISRKVGS
jgi:DNA polymerase elongation subunit (family B)